MKIVSKSHRSNLLLLAMMICLVGFNSQIQAQDDKQEGKEQESGQLTVADIREMITDGKLRKASEALDELLKEEPNKRQLHNMRMAVASAFMRKRNYKGAAAQWEKLVEYGFENIEKDQSSITYLSNGIRMLNLLYPRAGQSTKSVELVERALNFFRERQSDNFRENVILVNLVGVRAGHLRRDKKTDEAKQLIDKELERIKKIYEADPEKDQSLSLYANILKTAITSRLFDDETNETRVEQLKKMVSDAVNENLDSRVLANEYYSTMGLLIARDAREKPEQAQKLLDEALDTFKKMAEEQPDNQMIDRHLTGLMRNEPRIKSALKIKKMIGQPAPELDVEAWVNGDELDLTGKVVMLDFYAVWCGPCIATFPELRQWYDEYNEKGFEIVGVTRQYNYQWDEEKNRAVKMQDEEVEFEDEVAMLEKFIERHKLKHRSIMTPQGSKMNRAFGVTGIPHAVLIDRKGNVRMVKIGATPENKKALQAMIEKLVDEKE